MTSLRAATAGVAVAFGVLLFEGQTRACDDRFGCSIKPQATETVRDQAKATKQRRSVRQRATRSRLAVQGTARGRTSRIAGRRKPAKARVAQHWQQRRTSAVAARLARRSVAERRFQAFITPRPAAESEFESWRLPRVVVAHLIEPASPWATPLAGQAEPPATVGQAPPATAVTQVAPPPLQTAERRPTGNVYVLASGHADAPDGSDFLRYLMLALGGVATLASAVRLIVGA